MGQRQHICDEHPCECCGLEDECACIAIVEVTSRVGKCRVCRAPMYEIDMDTGGEATCHA